MPLNSIPPTTTLAGFGEKIASARGKCDVDVGFWGGVVPGNTCELEPLFQAGVVGFKCFLIESGVDEFPNVNESNLREAMPVLTRLGAVLIVHAEAPGPIQIAGLKTSKDDPRAYSTFLASRPRVAEDLAIALVIRLCREFGTRVHIVHHSSADSLEMLRDAKREGLPITVETCPHYLVFAAEDIEDGATEFKCCPPIRERENQEKLWQALVDGTIDMIVSDHSPCPPQMKARESGDFRQAWGGISSLQVRLPVIWTAARRRGFSLTQLNDWLCARPARLVGLDFRKGKIAPGYDADFVIWNSDKSFQFDASMIHHRHKLTPYEGMRLEGVVEKTFLRGSLVYDRGEFPVSCGGELLGTHLLAGEIRKWN
jgi:allantoinase